MSEVNRFSALVAGVPLNRGSPVHIEEDELAFTQLSGDQVVAIHTPQEIFPRVHEYMHALHSDEIVMRRVYAGCEFVVMQLAEDCRLHTCCWPWHRYGETPQLIREATKAWLRRELTALNKAIKGGEKVSDFSDFAVRLRQAAIRLGAGINRRRDVLNKVGFREPFYDLANHVLDMFQDGREQEAAAIIQMTFFGPKPAEPKDMANGTGEAVGEKITPYEGVVKQPKMTIVELPHTVRIPEAKIGFRRATMGPRLHRPSLRKPVLPQRLFVKRSPRKPDGTILIDASGSMGSFDVVSKWVERAPFGTVAYYAGSSHAGTLWVYARNGLKAEEPVQPKFGGNTVDGPAIDWLLRQKPPFIMITDKGFCGASDSFAQIARLEVLEKQGIIKVMDYAHDEEAEPF